MAAGGFACGTENLAFVLLRPRAPAKPLAESVSTTGDIWRTVSFRGEEMSKTIDILVLKEGGRLFQYPVFS